MVTPEAIEQLKPRFGEGQKIMVAARGITPVLRFALDEAQLRKAMLYVLYVKEVAVFMPVGTAPARPKWQDDPEAAAIMTVMMKIGQEGDITAASDYPA